jgi:hypothetical protein
MADPVFSPDGQWMWTGEDWIPAPPSGAEGEVSNSQVSNSSNSNNQNTTTVQINMPFSNIRSPDINQLGLDVSISHYYRHIGAGLILLSLLMPYYFGFISGFFVVKEGLLFELSIIDIIDVISIDLTTGLGFLLLYLVALTPNIFFITSLLAISQLIRNKSTRLTGTFHLAYFILVVVLTLIAGITAGEFFSALTASYGYGFWIGGISGIALLISPAEVSAQIIHEERNESPSDEVETLNSQGSNPILDSPTRGNIPSSTDLDPNYPPMPSAPPTQTPPPMPSAPPTQTPPPMPSAPPTQTPPPMPSAPPSPQTSQEVNHSRRRLFDLITQRGFNIGEFEFFNDKMQTEEGRRLFYAHATANNMPIGTWDDFEQKMK